MKAEPEGKICYNFNCGNEATHPRWFGKFRRWVCDVCFYRRKEAMIKVKKRRAELAKNG